MSTDTRRRIRALNDALWQKHEGGRVALSAGVAALPPETVVEIVAAASAFDDFDTDNDPHGEHDMGLVCAGGERIIWKIDYYDRSLSVLSPDAADPNVTTRVLTIMLASDW